MSAVVFENDGVLEERAIRTFGVSAKEKENPIGFFGTGLKYAIAILLRERHHIEVITGGRHYKFETKIIQMRGQDFEIITMNGEELPFTTKLGINWEVWQAFREVYCNCSDENGTVYYTQEVAIDEEAVKDKTYIIIRGDKILDAYLDRDRIILNISNSLKISSGSVDVYNQASKSVYYRGIRVYDLPIPTMYTYNILDGVELTEDRTLKHPSVALDKLPEALFAMKEKHLIRNALLADKSYAEHEFSFTSLAWSEHRCSAEFFEVLEREYKSNNDKLNRSARNYFMKKTHQSASKHYDPEELSLVEKKQLDRAVDICKLNWTDFSDYKILVVKSLGNNTLALADMNENVMVISKKVFTFGTKYLTATLIEEYLHLKTGYSDCTRELQTHLFDTICTMIENHVIQEPI